MINVILNLKIDQIRGKNLLGYDYIFRSTEYVFINSCFNGQKCNVDTSTPK